MLLTGADFKKEIRLSKWLLYIQNATQVLWCICYLIVIFIPGRLKWDIQFSYYYFPLDGEVTSVISKYNIR